MSMVTVFLNLLLFAGTLLVNADSSPAWAVTNWTTGAHATFYGGQDGAGTMNGACGFGNLYSTGYGLSNAALSNPLFNGGLTCGACFEIECILSQGPWCYPGASITITATNACPPGSFGGWCDPPKLHFDLAYPMFTTLSQAGAGVIPVQYRRVSCSKKGGVRFTMNGNPWWDIVLVTNVAGSGNVVGLSVTGNTGGWFALTQNWGQNWASNWASNGTNVYNGLIGQSLGFQVTVGNGSTQAFDKVAQSNWIFGQTFEGNTNF